MIRFVESESALLLFVPYGERERAKRVEGRRWDAERKCWVYPKTARAYDAVISEFGSDIDVLEASRPTATTPPPVKATTASVNQLEQHNVALKEQLNQVLATLAVIKEGDGGRKESALRERLAAKEQELAGLRERTAELTKREDELQAQLYAVQKEAARAKAERDALTRELALLRTQGTTPPPPQASGLYTSVKEASRKILGATSSLYTFFDGRVLDDHLSVELGKLLERELRSRLRAYSDVRLHDLIRMAEDDEVLSSEGADLAHIIRKQRNQVAHDNVAKVTYPIRGVLALSAAALLWSELD